MVLGLFPAAENLERDFGLAWLFQTRGPIAPPNEVAVIAINERSAAALGLPALPRDWSRSVHARLIERLSASGAGAIVFDMDFRRPKPADDPVFAQAMGASGRVVLVDTLTGKRQPIADASGRETGTVWVQQLQQPAPVLAEAARGLGPFPLPKIETNVFAFWAFKPSVNDALTLPGTALQVFALSVYPQWRNLVERSGGPPLPEAAALRSAEDLRHLARTLRRALRDDAALRARLNSALEKSRAGMPAATYRLLKALVRMYGGDDDRFLNLYGPPGTISTIPYNAVITGADPNVDPRALDFRGKVVFVGFSDLLDPGQPDRFYTVFTDEHGVDLSGVELAATAFANLLTDRSITPVDGLAGALMVFAFGFVVGAGFHALSAMIALPLGFALAGSYVALAGLLFRTHDLWLPLAIPMLVQLPVALFAGLLAQYLVERRQRRRMNKAVEAYLPEPVAHEFTQNEIEASALDKTVYGICLNHDMSGFSALAQGKTPAELADFMNSYFETIALALKRHHASVTEFHADSVMCAWIAANGGLPARRDAILAGLAVVAAVEAFASAHPGRALRPRVGLAEGAFYLGHTGGGGRMGYTILGDPANAAARLEALNNVLGTRVLASEEVIGDTTDLLVRPLGRFALAGRTTPLAVVEIVAEASTATPEQRENCARFALALEAFHGHDWANARAMFDALLASCPGDGPARLYRDLSAACERETPRTDDPCVVIVQSKD